MINVLFFAHLKETLDCDHLPVAADEIKDVATLRLKLSDNGPQWAKSLACGATLVAVNQAMANEQTVITDGDEVAFFPPVTGG